MAINQQSYEADQIINIGLYQDNMVYKILIDRIPIHLFTRKSAVNSIKHGMNSANILPCKKHTCFYWSTCFLASNGDIDNIDFSEPCSIEVGIYLHHSEVYSMHFEDRQNDCELLDKLYELIMIEIKQYRLSGMRVIEAGELARPNVPRWNYKGLALSYRYSSGLLSTKLNALSVLSKAPNN
ncbi:hypothetical protein [Paenibacillus sp. FSL H8-0034]|uniref:hypothetical protein n=1 Tax=Paenibacillus sp. FSL H8-0034 TaxID=2954671 RepID=UPI0030FB3703